MFSKPKQLFKRGETTLEPQATPDVDLDLSWLDPPSDPSQRGAWDEYWSEQVRHGLGPALFDMFCDDRDLIGVMESEGMRTVLCAGNGISQEPRALAEAGFSVVALDVSPVAVEIARECEFPAQYFERFCSPGSRRPGGHVDYVVGDILDTSFAPGPFDVVIERRTAQLFFGQNMAGVLDAMAKRLSENGIFLTHCHDGAWRPPAEPRHFPETWFEETGRTLWRGGPGRKPPGRVAWPVTSTG
jgi:hypothetical protein